MPTTSERLHPRTFRRRCVDSVWWHWLAKRVAASPALDTRTRGRILRAAGIDAGSALVESGCFFFGADVHLGDYAWINHGCYFDARDSITIGKQCSIAME